MRDVTASATGVNTFNNCAGEDSRYYHGHQWPDLDRMRMEQLRRPALVFNEIGDKIDAISGLERLNRQDVHAVSRAVDSDMLHDAAGDLASETVGCVLDMCLIGNTRVQAGNNLRRGFRRTYKGTLICIELSNGQSLTGTPNHPVLTKMGWVKLGLLRENDEAVDGSRLLQHLRPLEHHFNDVETSIQDRVESLARDATLIQTLTSRREDFHGDGIDGNVYTVATNGFLIDWRESSRCQQRSKLSFKWSDITTAFSRGLFTGLCLAKCAIALPSMQFVPLFSGEALTQGFGGLRFVSEFDSSALQASVNHLPGNGKFASEFRSTHALVVEYYKRLGLQFSMALHGICNLAGIAQFVTSGAEAFTDAGDGDVDPLTDLRSRQILREIESGQFFRRNRGLMPPTLRVTKYTEMHDASCDVFNLDTESGFYIANGVIVHNCDGELEDSRAIKDCAITGMGWVEILTSYDDDPDGRVVARRLPYKEMGWDTKAVQDNIEDAKFRYRKRDFSRSDFKKRFPGMIEKVDGAITYYEESDVNKYELVTPYYSRANEEANPQVGQRTERSNSIPVIQFQYRDQIPIWRIADPQNPDALQTLTEEQWDALTTKNDLAGQPMPKAVRQLKPVYKQCYVSLGVVLEDEVVLPAGWSLLCITGQYDEVKKTWYGIVRSLKDPQNTMNKAISSLVTQYITNAKGGVIFKTGTFADVNMAKDQWARADGWIEANADANLATDIMPRQPQNISQVPPMLFQEAKTSMSRISGVSDEMLGIATGDATGPSIGARVQGGLMILGWFWDNISRFRKQQFRTILEFVREYWSYGQLVRVGGDFNSKAIPLFKSELPAQDQYDMILDDSVRHNPNLKQQIWSDLMQIAGPLMKSPIGQQFLLKALKFSPLPTSIVAELQELAQQAAQQPQKPQKGGKQEDPQMTQAKIQKLGADTQRSLAEANAIDRKSNLELAQLTSETLLKSGELAHKRNIEHTKILHDRIAAAKQQMNGTGAPNGIGNQT